ncbi:hypothetical protein PIB30_013208 [Stylosanthes scabra]|uniref:DUF4283 domain-containing protein n=1 Tax=Stylosanthes scabra TaxID=79078 RepID=A0ABU6Q7C6_9FABA|nr:hypothetical protein [Stylosanthes scabra]
MSWCSHLRQEGYSLVGQVLKEQGGSWASDGKVLDTAVLIVNRATKQFQSMTLAREDPVLLSIFDEIKDNWEFVWSHSQRAWVEFTGFPIHLWSKEAFQKICKVWGKFVIEDKVTSKKLLFTTPRVLVNSYTWEPIQQWIALRVEDRSFEIYARECGRDVYSILSHPVVTISKDLVVRTTEIESGDMEATQTRVAPACLGRTETELSAVPETNLCSVLEGLENKGGPPPEELMMINDSNNEASVGNEVIQPINVLFFVSALIFFLVNPFTVNNIDASLGHLCQMSQLRLRPFLCFPYFLVFPLKSAESFIVADWRIVGWEVLLAVMWGLVSGVLAILRLTGGIAVSSKKFCAAATMLSFSSCGHLSEHAEESVHEPIRDDVQVADAYLIVEPPR